MTEHIVLIEDNAQNRYLLAFLLEQHGYRVSAATDGPAGLETVRATRPDAILLDIQLPGMDGYEVATALRSVEALAAVPIIAVTSYAMAGDRERALASGCDGYIEKPIDPDTFVTTLRAQIDAARQGAEAS